MISQLLRRAFTPASVRRRAAELYAQAVAQARQPIFYTQYDVPDTVDGRFDMIALQVFLSSRELAAAKDTQAERLRQWMIDQMFEDMDRSLREMGIGDMSIGKKVQKMAYALNGRMETYETGWGDVAALSESLWRNVYRSDEAKHGAATVLARYLMDSNTD